ncbi:MAG: S8 family peptidase [Hydrogenophaga sp.]|uniref:S8 family peptidase n=1 Tax=Hydrogenophaga sp. TaxID=1904254 RepID=UPI002AB878A5|nr:S8 family peptidase [Hydrogenophaga sp.]MDZ4100992.1 S8 family peptidase [Hydrogenophaga sp.]MDZ4239517.1 S8 family peptidase [Hydrogenophaga sp.]
MPHPTARPHPLRSALAAMLLGASATGAAAQGTNPNAPSHRFTESRSVAGQYIVVFRNGVTNPTALAAQLAQQNNGRLLHTYSNALRGFAAVLSPAAVQALSNNPNVEYIEPDSTISLNTSANNAAEAPAEQRQNSATWGLDRIDQRDRPVSTTYEYRYTGAPVHAFIVDTGIRSTHVDMAGRVSSSGYTAINDGQGSNDCNGHGTHVAATVGGASWGVAKGVNLVPVRVLDCAGSGSTSGVIAGLDYIVRDTRRPAVANLSLGGGASTTMDNAVANTVASGVTVVVAAGNSNKDACNYSPARAPSAITVGATTSADARASYSNFGPCLDVFAPGSAITSAWHTSDTATASLNGTSMAAPHVAGVVALALAADPLATPSGIAPFVLDNASLNKVSSAGSNSPNRLVYSLASGTPPQATVQTTRVVSISGRATKNRTAWLAYATVTLHYAGGTLAGQPVPNATVSGSFNPGGAKTCTTSTLGSCTLISSSLSYKSVVSTTFTVTGVSGTDLVYDATQNSAVQTVIARP